MPEDMTVEALLERVENRNRRFKAASVVFGAVLTAGLALLLVIALHTLQGVNTQLSSQKTLLASQSQILSKISGASVQRTAQINDLQKHIDCVVELFQQPNRANLTITDLEDCQLTSTATGKTSSNSPVVSTPPQTSNSGAASTQNTTSGGVTNTTQTAPTPVDNSSTLDRVPVLGRVFKSLGL